MDLQIVDNADVVEPVTLAEAKSYMQIDADYSANDADITMSITSARKRLEAFLNIGLVKREITVFWGGNEIELPLSPTGEITSVLRGGTALSTDDYYVIKMPANRIGINSACGLSGEWFYSLSGYVEFTPINVANTDVYSCVYQTGYESLDNKPDLKQAIMAECAHLYKLRGLPVSDVIGPNAAILASSYSRNLIL